MNDVLVHPARVEDAEGIASVHVTAWQETYRGLIVDEFLDRLSIERMTSRWKQTLSDPNDVYHRAFVASSEGRIIGFANYGNEQTNDPDHSGELFAIYVLKQLQGMGVGRALIGHVATELLEQGISSMLVWVLAENPYHRFYESLGGVFLRERTIDFAGLPLHEKAYGWKDIRPLAG
jgi:GNAT superfamily N-acetyltransferase